MHQNSNSFLCHLVMVYSWLNVKQFKEYVCTQVYGKLIVNLGGDGISSVKYNFYDLLIDCYRY